MSDLPLALLGLGVGVGGLLLCCAALLLMGAWGSTRPRPARSTLRQRTPVRLTEEQVRAIMRRTQAASWAAWVAREEEEER